MELIFTITGAPDYPHDLRSSHTFRQAGGTIGRNQRCDWPLPDDRRHLSGLHAEVTFEDGRFYLTDLSTNGTFIQTSGERLPANQPVPVIHGTVYVFGEYLLQARLTQDLDLYQEVAGQPRSDANIIPDDDFLDLDPIRALSQQQEQEHYHQPVADDWQGASTQGLSTPHTAAPDTSLLDQPTIADSAEHMTDAVPPPAFARAPEPEPEPPMPPETVTAPPANPAEPLTDSEWQHLCNALGVPLADVPAGQRADLLTRLGGMLRLAVTGTMQGLRTRADIKNEMRLNMTVVQSEGNNPLKFCSDYQQAMELMLKPRTGYLSGEQALRQGMQELQAHQVASLAATRAAINGVIEQLSPERLVYRFEQTISKPRFGRVDGRYWRAYHQLHQSLNDDQDWRQSLFSRHYSTTYEEQAQLLATANPNLDRQDTP
ncbi:type VI secretion system-associated FHA domain protein TagH [Oceanimonas sp. CHS3-5]|uniref:type VI secretion system-associated FHA domain protein TagH n=1 Tax=Oceanimonas sp. CHS3-5 TaxID=3068186 RepID=UPI00273D54F6|nr:type VI secretion system-associated FHA domain protein TagH [Oceanimonas sp. CHS3-5]MDP5291705.1 type VI secretion system-associated FHA domain protein TagH [Oceanimonas sp. CHS3-5]